MLVQANLDFGPCGSFQMHAAAALWANSASFTCSSIVFHMQLHFANTASCSAWANMRFTLSKSRFNSFQLWLPSFS